MSEWQRSQMGGFIETCKLVENLCQANIFYKQEGPEGPGSLTWEVQY